MGVFDGTNGDVKELFDKNSSLDDITSIPASAITGRINLGDPEKRKIYKRIIFQGDYADPQSNGGTLRYFKDSDDPQITFDPADLHTFSGDGDRKRLTQPTGRFIHLLIEDSTMQGEKILLQDFTVHYRDKNKSESR
jgi:hypothetical protein